MVRPEVRRSRGETRCEPAALEASDVDEQLTATWLGAKVRDALDKLPTEQREAVVLAYYGGRSYRQVAVELAIPEGTAKSRVRIALSKLDGLLRADYLTQDPAWT